MSARTNYGRYDKDFDLTGELLERDNETTPDFLKLKLKDYHPVFVYGTLKKGGRLNHMIDHCPFLGDAQTVTQNYELSNTGGAFPIMRAKTNSPESGAVFGEVYMCDPKTILRLDEIEANGVMYDRVERHVWLFDQGIQKEHGGSLYPSVKAFCYFANPEYWRGMPVVRIEPKKDKKGRNVYDFDVNTRLAA